SKDESSDLKEEEEALPEARRHALESIEEIAPNTFETPTSPKWSSGSLPVSPSSPVVPSPIASPTTTPAATISVDKDQFLEVGAQLELHESIFHDHTHRLDALPSNLFRSLEQEQERATVTFGALWRPVLALEAWAGHHTAMQRDLQGMRDRVATVEQERSRRGQ
ncbi:hypothetical protein Tco_0594069, partial [Tanacetum coccineum]